MCTQALAELGKQGHLASYWSTTALLKQAGMEGPFDGADVGADAVLWRCELCGVPATSARNLEVHCDLLPVCYHVVQLLVSF